jgi:hypothetical protein
VYVFCALSALVYELYALSALVYVFCALSALVYELYALSALVYELYALSALVYELYALSALVYVFCALSALVYIFYALSALVYVLYALSALVYVFSPYQQKFFHEMWKKRKQLYFYWWWPWPIFTVRASKEAYRVCYIVHAFRAGSDKQLYVFQFCHRSWWRKGQSILPDWRVWVNYVCWCLMDDTHSRIFDERCCKNTATFTIIRNIRHTLFIHRQLRISNGVGKN